MISLSAKDFVDTMQRMARLGLMPEPARIEDLAARARDGEAISFFDLQIAATEAAAAATRSSSVSAYIEDRAREIGAGGRWSPLPLIGAGGPLLAMRHELSSEFKGEKGNPEYWAQNKTVGIDPILSGLAPDGRLIQGLVMMGLPLEQALHSARSIDAPPLIEDPRDIKSSINDAYRVWQLESGKTSFIILTNFIGEEMRRGKFDLAPLTAYRLARLHELQSAKQPEARLEFAKRGISEFLALRDTVDGGIPEAIKDEIALAMLSRRAPTDPSVVSMLSAQFMHVKESFKGLGFADVPAPLVGLAAFFESAFPLEGEEIGDSLLYNAKNVRGFLLKARNAMRPAPGAGPETFRCGQVSGRLEISDSSIDYAAAMLAGLSTFSAPQRNQQLLAQQQRMARDSLNLLRSNAADLYNPRRHGNPPILQLAQETQEGAAKYSSTPDAAVGLPETPVLTEEEIDAAMGAEVLQNTWEDTADAITTAAAAADIPAAVPKGLMP